MLFAHVFNLSGGLLCREGYDKEGFDRFHFDKYGYDKDGHDYHVSKAQGTWQLKRVLTGTSW